jgi:hypothetical protein
VVPLRQRQEGLQADSEPARLRHPWGRIMVMMVWVL